ncbi:MAG: hypothetical protein ACLUEV_04690 [Alistipes sp.]
MINFEYYNPAKIIFGKGVENGVGRKSPNMGNGAAALRRRRSSATACTTGS